MKRLFFALMTVFTLSGCAGFLQKSSLGPETVTVTKPEFVTVREFVPVPSEFTLEISIPAPVAPGIYQAWTFEQKEEYFTNYTAILFSVIAHQRLNIRAIKKWSTDQTEYFKKGVP